jgi:hypothetical protein
LRLKKRNSRPDIHHAQRITDRTFNGRPVTPGYDERFPMRKNGAVRGHGHCVAVGRLQFYRETFRLGLLPTY